MGHQADDAAVGGADARDVALRTVRIVAVAEHHAAVAFELVEYFVAGHEAAFARFQRHQDVGADLIACGPRGRIRDDLQPQIAAYEMQTGVTGERPG
jgi:hypothetical protein